MTTPLSTISILELWKIISRSVGRLPAGLSVLSQSAIILYLYLLSPQQPAKDRNGRTNSLPSPGQIITIVISRSPMRKFELCRYLHDSNLGCCDLPVEVPNPDRRS
ncbi:hypothetical protein PM082_021829 [Marasmius tenuissimus]|nr:hypothetical protein PM082_021829 [Marasmius tenuissimus]